MQSDKVQDVVQNSTLDATFIKTKTNWKTKLNAYLNTKH